MSRPQYIICRIFPISFNFFNFFRFCNDERASVKGVHGEFTPSEISKELGRRWGEADAPTKQKYEQMAQDDKARYERVR